MYICKKINQLKKFITIFLLFCFSIRPTYYIGQLVYFELNLDTIIEKYCVNKDKPEFQCNGKCHLATQLSNTSNKNDDNNNKSLRVIFESFLPVFISTSQDIKFNNPVIDAYKENSFCYGNSYFFLHESRAYKPPIS